MFSTFSTFISLGKSNALVLSTKTFIPLSNDYFTSNTTTNKGASNYAISASSFTYDNGYGPPFYAFDGNAATYWHCSYDSSPYSNGIYIGGFKTIVSDVSLSGEWLQIKLPSPQIIKFFVIQNRSGYNGSRYPKLFTFAGSNDGNTWSKISTISLSEAPIDGSPNKYSTSSNTISYSYYRLIFQSLFDGNVVHLAQFNLFGL
jgi:hypothetical protein